MTDASLISLCLIVKNEEDLLPRCLASATDLVGETVLVDTGSTDRTRAVAVEYGARVVEFAWRDDFAAARNECLRHATKPWILWLDADEYFDEANRAKLAKLLAGLADEKAAYVMAQRSHHGAGGLGARVQHVRLFRNCPEVRWEYRVHEQLLPSLRRAGHQVRFTDIVLEHTGYVDAATRARKFERNLALLRLAQAERPEDPFVLFNLGLAYCQLGREDEAIPLLGDSLRRSRPGDSITGKLYASLVKAHEGLGQEAEALALCRTGRARCPAEAELLYLDGRLRRQRGDLGGAAECWRQLLAAVGGERNAVLPAPGFFADADEGFGIAAREELGFLCREQGRDGEAEEHWRAAADLGQSPRALGALGELFLVQGRWAELEEIAGRLEGAVGVAGLVLRGRGCLARQEYAAARKHLKTAIGKDPCALAPHLYLTHVLLQEGTDLPAAEQALRRLLTLDPGQAEGWRNLAVLLRKQDRLGEAVVACQSGLARCPHNPDLLLLGGMLFVESGDLANAEAALVRVLELDASMPADKNGRAARSTSARHNLAMVYQRQGRLAEAEAQWRAALADRPDLAAAWLGLADICLARQRYAEVEAIVERIAAGPEAAAGRLLHARLHMERKQFPQARRLLEDAIAADARAPLPRRLLTYALLQEGKDPAAADTALCSLLELCPGDTEARRNLNLLRGRMSH